MSLFGDDCVEDIFNDNLNENQLPSDDDREKDINGDGEEGNDEEQGPIKVEPKKRSARNPRHRLTIETLQGPRGIHTIEEYFKDIKFCGKGQERKDLNEIMRRLQHWAHRMYPSYKFDDVVANIERLGKKKALQVHMSKYRLGLLQTQPIQGQQIDYEDEEPAMQDEPFDEFDALLGEQIAISKLAPKTPSSSRPHSSMSGNSFNTPAFGRGAAVMSTPYSGIFNLDESSDLAQPLPPSQPMTPIRENTPEPAEKPKLSAEQMARIAENRRLAMERLKAKKAQEEFESL